MPKRERSLAHAPLASYALWVHSHSFVTAVCHPHVYDALHMEQFQSWAGRVGMVLDEVTLPYIQLALVNIRKPSFLQGALRAYFRVRRGGGEVPPTPAAAVAPSGHLALRIFQGGYKIDLCLPAVGVQRRPTMARFGSGGSGSFGASGNNCIHVQNGLWHGGSGCTLTICGPG